ncbi:DUF7144 family membrane protein [Kitasatospora sp. McL0602]|uniref:DUF7144 family membrane protein n=1 Tax=Kitasatospora sp. McL0602 TaxID=3439530 RepID=UPI003F8BDF8B
MSSAAPGSSRPTSARSSRSSGLAAGGTVFAGVMMLVDGVLGVLQGIMGLAKNHVYVSTPSYVFRFSLTTWGWIHLLLGALVALIGLAVLTGAAWARWTAVGLTALSVVAQFMFLPYYPLWSLVTLAIDVFVIWALSRYRD